MDQTQSIQHHFGGAAAAYAASAVHRGGPDLDAMLAAAPAAAGVRVLDLGCGPGHTSLAFGARGADVLAVDLTEAMLEAGRGLAAERGLSNVRFQLADAAALPLAEGAFDVVTSRLSAHHYTDPDRVLREVRRVLARDGVFLLCDIVAPEDPARDTFLNAFELLRDPSHVRDHRISEWQAMFRAAGLAPESIGAWTMHLDFTDWVRRIGTPPASVAALRSLFGAVPADVRESFAINGADTDHFTLEVAVLRGRPQR